MRMRKKSRMPQPTWTFNETTNRLECDEWALALQQMLRKAKGQKSGSKLESKVASDLAALGLMAGCQQQYKFHAKRKWKADFAWPKGFVGWDSNGKLNSAGIMLEVNGGTYLQGNRRGAHSRGKRQRQDYEKWSEASMMGWIVILVDSVDVRNGVHVDRVLRAMEVV